MKNKNILVVVSLILVFITIYIIRDTYGLFESKNIMNTNTNIAKWNVLINGTDIKSGENFVVNSVNIVGSDSVKNGKMAPGTEGYFDILIDPADTDTSILYSVTFDFTKVNGSFAIERIEETTSGNLIRTGENTYSKVITLEEIKNKVTNTIRVYIKWNNVEENNEEDSKIGLTKDNFISIPVSVSVIQYLGEPVVEYQNE